MHKDQETDIRLPEPLRRQFEAMERRLWRRETLILAGGGLGAFLLSFLLVFLSDRLWDTPSWLRFLLLVSAAGAAATLGVWWLRRWTWNRRDLRSLSKLVQRHHRQLGDRLLGIVELADERKRPAGMSPALCRAAIQQVSSQAERFDFRESVPLRAARVSTLALVYLLVMVMLPWLLTPLAAWSAFVRWSLPAGSMPRYTFVDLAEIPEQLTVPHGEPFTLEGKVRYRWIWRPRAARVEIGDQDPLKANVEAGQLSIALPGQTREAAGIIRVGDARKEVVIHPAHRPYLKELTAAIQLPEYLKHPEQREPVKGALKVLAGSRVALRGEASRALGGMQITSGESGQSINATISGENFETAAIDPGTVQQLTLSWSDTLGLAGAAPMVLPVQAMNDFAPRVHLPDLAAETSILETDILPIRMAAEDDYGVQEIGLVLQLVSPADFTASQSQRELIFGADGSQKRKMAETYLLNPAIQRIPPGAILEVRAVATDFFPGRQRVESRAHRVHVIGLAQHAEWTRQQLEALFARLEEITRLEESIHAKTRELNTLPEERLKADEAGREAGEQAREQSKNASHLEELTREGMKALMEAFRNPAFSAETLREWARNLQTMQELSRKEMQQAAKSLQNAQQNSANRSEPLSQAQQTQEEILKSLEDLQKQMNRGLDNLQAQTLAQRLRQVATSEEEIARHLERMLPETIGLMPDQLSPRFQQANSGLKDDQLKRQEESRELEAEIGRFFERTQREPYGDVSKEMKEGRAVEELERISSLIQSNISMEAMQQLGNWSGKFNEWADRLEPKKEDSSGGAGAGGGGQSGDDMIKQFMTLLRLRSQEVNLRESTRLLEQQRAGDERYKESAEKLASTQEKMRRELEGLQRENQIPVLEKPLDEARKAMASAESLLRKPETGAPTDKEQVEAISVLTDLINIINEQAQKNQQSSSSGSGSEMEFLMQMMAQAMQPGMGQGEGMSPGGGLSGGGTGQPAGGLTGNARGQAGPSRSASRAAGRTENLPAEFREALENYFKAVERTP